MLHASARSRLWAGILLCLLFAACGNPPPPAAAPTLRSATADDPPSSSTLATGLLEHLRTPSTVDGIELDTWIVRPHDLEEVPTILIVTPYYGGGDPRAVTGLGVLNRLGGVMVPQGYAVGVSSVRGTGNSAGCFTQGGPQESMDTASVIEHIAAQDWSTGAVGLIGASYDGTTPQDVWLDAPPALKTVVPVAGISDFYKYNFVNGVPIFIQGLGFNTYYWGMVGLAPAGLSGGAQVGDAQSVPAAVLGEVCADQLDVQYGGVTSTVDGNKDGYWQQRDFLAELRRDPQRPRPSVFYVHGLEDWNVKPHMMEDWLDAIADSGVPYKIWLGQWGHAWPQSGNCAAGACRNDWWDAQLLDWFDQFLKGRDTGILDRPRVQVQNDQMLWRHEEHWPPREVRRDRWYLDGEQLTMAGPGSGTATYFDYFGKWLDGAAGTDSTLSAAGADRVVFESEALTETLHLAGQPVFTATVTADADRAALMLTLLEVNDVGQTRAINYAAQSLNHVADLSAGAGSIAGRAQTVTVRFFPQDDVVQAGSRLRLVAAGNLVGGRGPDLLPVSSGANISIDLGSAMLELPVDETINLEQPQPFGF